MKLKQIVLSYPVPVRDEQCKRFNWSANCIADLFERHLHGYKTDGIFRVNIRVVPPVQAKLGVVNLVDVVQVDYPIDLTYYEQLPDFDRRALCATAIHHSLCRVAEQRGWDPAPVDAAYAAIKALKYLNIIQWGKLKSNPSRRVRAQIECDFGSESLEGAVRFSDRTGTALGTRQLFSLPPSEFELTKALGNLRWVSDTRVELTSADKSRSWSASFET
jgi:hypothetical protein